MMSFYDRIVDWFVKRKVANNQDYLLRALKRNNCSICIEVQPLEVGSIEHYYHFLLDLLLPLSQLIQRTPNHCVFEIENFGPLTHHLTDFYGNRIEIVPHDDHRKKYTMLGMDAIGLRASYFDYSLIKSQAYFNYFVDVEKTPNKIVLIERVRPDSFYLNEAHFKGSGATRRSIVNHVKLVEVLQDMVQAPYVFQNVVFERMSMEEQVQLMSETAVLIGQHGAGLANAIWMQNGGTVIEFGHNNLKYFEKIAKGNQLNYFLYKNYQPNHIAVDEYNFRKWLREEPDLHYFFN